MNERERQIIPARETRVEITVLNSHFITTAAPAFTVEEARSFVGRIKEEFADAAHHVPAFIVGHGGRVIAHCSDDGEPAGTAGRPCLAVLQGSGLGDIVVVVTRYFGGTKLGTGGLVRAYGDAVRSLLEELPLAVKRATHLVMMAVTYGLLEQTRLLIDREQGTVLAEDFAAEVTITARFPVEQLAPFNLALQALSGGRHQAEIIATEESTIMPLDPGES